MDPEQYKLKIRQIKEKLVTFGCERLSDEELLCFILSSTGDGIVDSQHVIDKLGGGIGGVASANLKTLRMIDGIGVSRASLLLAAIELGRRAERSQAIDKVAIRNSADVIEMFTPIIGSLAHEEFWAVYLNRGNGILDKVKISQGGTCQTVVDHKLIVKRAVELLSCAVVLVHNHPSGIAKPSEDDIEMTRRLITACSLFDIAVVDHVIIASSGNMSFRTEGLI